MVCSQFDELSAVVLRVRPCQIAFVSSLAPSLPDAFQQVGGVGDKLPSLLLISGLPAGLRRDGPRAPLGGKLSMPRETLLRAERIRQCAFGVAALKHRLRERERRLGNQVKVI